jgi:hypothetical protein
MPFPEHGTASETAGKQRKTARYQRDISDGTAAFPVAAAERAVSASTSLPI